MDAKLNQIVSDIAIEHDHIKKLLADLKDCDHLHLIPMLEELTSVLEHHFMQETRSGGLYESVGAKSEAHRNEVQRLEQEHAVMESAFRGLVARAKLSSASSEPELLREIAAIADCLNDHERREAEMVKKLLNA